MFTFFVSRIIFITGVMSANFRIKGKVNELIHLLTLPNIKGENTSKFFLIFVGISHEWRPLFVFKHFISFSASVRDFVLKEKLKLNFSIIFRNF